MAKLNQPVSTLNDTHPTDCPHTLAVRTKYANWRWYYDKGYICYNLKYRKRHEHRLVAELAHRPVAGLHVHHVNGEITDNRAENLQVLTPSEHARLHILAKPRDYAAAEIVTYTCAHCGEEAQRQRSKLRHENHFCSSHCARLASRKVQWPGRDEMARLLVTVNNFCELGRMFGVSDNAVRKQAKKYGLNTKVVDGRTADNVTLSAVMGD